MPEQTTQPHINSQNAQRETAPLTDSSVPIIGSSRIMQDLLDMVQQVAASNAGILITGESGTGKELIASLIREKSTRREKPFLKINCNTINDSLLESDLFGYEKGSFTGAESRRKGKFEVVDTGTIFLDEIGDISSRMQAALLRVLQDGEIIRVGGNTPIKVDVRIIAATNTEIVSAVQRGEFRLDLYYRLNIINIYIPPLRERREDIADLASFFIHRYGKAFNKKVEVPVSPLMDKLISHDWPGNVRELENVIQRAVLMTKTGTITEADLLFDQQPEQPGIDPKSRHYQLGSQGLRGAMEEFESDVIGRVLMRNRYNVLDSARDLGIGKTALYDKMKKYNISPSRFSR